MTEKASEQGSLAKVANSLSIRRGLVGAVTLILVLFGMACLVSLATFENVQRARVFADRANAAFARTGELSDAVVRQEGALRGYTLSPSSRFLETLARINKQFDDALDALGENAIGSATQRRQLHEISALEDRWQRTVAQPIIALVQDGKVDAARDRLIAGDSIRIFDPLRQKLDVVQAGVLKQLDRSNAELGYRQQRARWVLLGVLVFGLIIGLITIMAILRRVTRPLTQLTQTTARLAAGERDVHIGFRERGDEIGSVARALEHFRQIILEQDRQAWIRDHRARLSVLMQRCRSSQELGDRVLTEIAKLCQAGYGALFAHATLEEDDDRFALLARYGYSDDVPHMFSPGDGLVGQVLVSHERVVLDELPADYLPVRSGLGKANPTVLLVLPALAGDHVVAVLELALFRRPSASELELLDMLLPNVALGLVTLGRTQRATELLDQSRAQTRALLESEERLRQQQDTLQEVNNELRMQGEELSAQSEELRASEEELKVQSDELQVGNEELRQKQELMSAQQSELSRLHAESEQRAEALARANQYKSDFLANMSHELRTPLNSLLILSRSLADNDESHLDHEEVEAAKIIHESGSNLLALINDILDLSKIEAGKMQVNAERAALSQLARRIERHFEPVAGRKGLDFGVRIGDNVPETVVTDVGKLEQVVRNLVSNALKFTQRGRVDVEIALPGADTTFRSAGLSVDNALAIHVSDEGIGIPPESLEQIFEAFEQVDAGASRSYGGTGLGLSISRELARLLGGEVAVQSKPGKGSRFSIYIHRALNPATIEARVAPEAAVDRASAGQVAESARSAEPTPVSVPQRVPAGAPHLLIIDDDEAFARAVAGAAHKRGFVCRMAANGEQGLELVHAQRPDAIVLDLGLPGMDGWAVLDRLKADVSTRDIPVHIVSAADDPDRSKQSGAVGFMQKPISRENLDKLFARAETLSGREARRVLVVDDDREAHTAIAHLLKRESVHITAVVSGEQALEALDSKGFDCVVLDLRLPDISGFELLEKISARADAPPVVVYSARELSEEETRLLRAHTDSIVIKGSHAQERLLDEISLFFHRITRPSRVTTPVPMAPARGMDADLTGTTALLVDDDMRNTFALSRVLRARGLKVLMASDGYKALDQLESHDDIGIVLMDIMMPGMDGYEAIRRIRAQPQHADLPIIALTAKAMPGDRDKCLEAGASEYLPKPLDTESLIGLVRALV